MAPIGFELSMAAMEEIRRLGDRARDGFQAFCRRIGATYPPQDIDLDDLFPFPRVPRFLHARPAYASARDRVTPGGVAYRRPHRVRRCSPRPWCGR